MTDNRFLDLAELQLWLDQIHSNKRITLICARFDIIHISLINYLKELKAAADYLLVCLTESDNKTGKIFSLADQAKILSAFPVIDKIILADCTKVMHLIRCFPDIHFIAEAENYLNQLNADLIRHISDKIANA
jgi:glycerol-3-phosphate cytidylyltransferase-like family protein